jgi:nucleoid-associated protein YgaU
MRTMTGVFAIPAVCSHGPEIPLEGSINRCRQETLAVKETFSARNVLVSLAVVAICIAALIWWRVISGRPDAPQVPAVAQTPAAKSDRAATAPAADKPASSPITEAVEALKDLGGRPDPAAPAATETGPRFDVARIEPNGEAVIAGQAAPGAAVELLVDGRVFDRTEADASGAFVFVPRQLPSGSYDLSLRATGADGKPVLSKSPVAVVALGGKTDKPVVAAEAPKAPGAAPRTESPVAALDSAKAPADGGSKPAADAGPAVRVDTVEAEEGGKLYVSGRAAAGATVRLYINDAFIAVGTASPEGRVAFSIQSGLRPGDYRIRLDQVDAAARVLSRAEVPFAAPAIVASPAAKPQESVVASRSSDPAAAPSAPTAAAPAAVASAGPVAPPASPSTPPPVASAPVASAPPQQLAPGIVPADRAAAGASPSGISPSASGPSASSPSSVSPSGAPGQAALPRQDRAVTAPALSTSPGPGSAPAPVAQAPQTPVTDAPTAQPAAPVQPATSTPRTAAATDERRDAVVVPSIDTRVIMRGDNLWRIGRATYGAGRRYTVIYRANKDQIRDPDLIYPGQIFVLPKNVVN